MHIVCVLFPNLTQLDLTGPYEVFHRAPGAKVHLAAATREPVRAEGGLAIVPTSTFDDAPEPDVLFVPGGAGINDAILDERLLLFVRRPARWYTSACTGALVLGAAGLLDGYQAATHWSAMKYLAAFGATAVKQRVVVDRDRITGGGVTAGIDIALTIIATTHGPEIAKAIQLGIEYDPAPPFDSGSPDRADEATVRAVQARLERMSVTREDAVVKAAAARLRFTR